MARFKYAMLSVAALLVATPVLKTYFAFHFHTQPKISAAHSVKVMSYNARNFDLYNWTKDPETLEKMMEMIRSEQPDIACFQEFFNSDSGKYQTIKWLLSKGGFKYFSFQKNVSRKKYDQWGVATFSRYPIIHEGEIRIENSSHNASLYTDIEVDSVIVRVFNVHLQSVYLSRQDYEYLDQVSNDQDVEVKPTRQIVSKLKRAFLIRAPQALKVRDGLSESKYPIIICGDLNDTPASFCYHTIGGNLQDAFLKAGKGIAPSYGGLLSAYRIDYILCDKKFGVTGYKTLCKKYSDHYPIESTINLN